MPRFWDEEGKKSAKADRKRNIFAAGDEGKKQRTASGARTLVFPLRRDLTWTESLRRPLASMERLFWIFLLLALLLSLGSLFRRLNVEWGNRVVAIAVEHREIVSLARQSNQKPADVFAHLSQRGVRGITVSEYTGKDLAAGAMPLYYGALTSIDPSLRIGVANTLDCAAILVDSSDPLLPQIMEYLRIRFPGVVKNVPGKRTLIVLPATVEELSDSGLLPDFPALRFAEEKQIDAIYRPAPGSGVTGETVAACVAWLKGKYPSVTSVLPAGQLIAGYPEIASLAAELKKLGLPVVQAEFVRQIGASNLYVAVKPNLVTLHSLVRDELLSRRLSRPQVVERMIRAVHERSVRILLMRPYDLYSSAKLPALLDDLQAIHDGIGSRGYSFGWPKPIPAFGATLPGALATSLLLIACLWYFIRRYIGETDCDATLFEGLFLFVLALFLGGAVWKIPFVTRLTGGFCAALCATEATLWALDKYAKPFAGLLAGLLIILIGGIVIASFYGTSDAMLRLKPFSGVKLTLLLPPLLVLASDMKQRIHPESLSAIVERPPLWGELILVGLLLLGALILTVRSDNAAFVPGWEIRFRDMLERALWVRPRTKEFLIGYPCLIVYYALIRRGRAAHYREVFRVGASLAFASAINTFCHFHTLLPLTIVRVVNGWWLGILIGFAIVVAIDYIGGPIWRRGAKGVFN